MIDIHTHILPGIDDGAKTLDESIDLLRDAVSQGISTVFATPHLLKGLFEPTPKEIKQVFHSLEEKVAEENINIKLVKGVEIGIGFEINPDEILHYTLNGGKYVLIELPFVAYPFNCEEKVFWFQSQGLIPIIAHPERAFSIQKEPNKLKDWKRRGVLIQINSKSVLGKYSKMVKKIAIYFLREGIVDFVATDTHNLEWGFDFLKVRPLLEKLVGKPKTDELLGQNAQRLLLAE